MEKKLATWLKDKYEVVNGEVKLKTSLKVKIGTKEVTIPDDGIWILAHSYKKDKSLIISCTPILKHSYVLLLKEKFGVKFVDYNWVKYPDNQNLWGYLLVTTEKGTVGDGEVHVSTLQPSMKGYAYTFLKKRAEDRAILQELGLYSQGLYSEVEVTPEMVGTTDYDRLQEEGNKVHKFRERVRQLNDYLGNSEDDLKNIISKITGQPIKNIEVDSVSADILAKTISKLEADSRTEFKNRKKLSTEIASLDKTKSIEDLLKVGSVELKKMLKELKQ